MKNYPLVSIITPVLNNKETIEDAIKSVLSQSYPNIRYIIIDGGSTDRTVNIIHVSPAIALVCLKSLIKPQFFIQPKSLSFS